MPFLKFVQPIRIWGYAAAGPEAGPPIRRGRTASHRPLDGEIHSPYGRSFILYHLNEKVVENVVSGILYRKRRLIPPLTNPTRGMTAASSYGRRFAACRGRVSRPVFFAFFGMIFLIFPAECATIEIMYFYEKGC